MTDELWHLVEGDTSIVTTAIHDGHALRPEVAERMALGEAERRYEEDPHTGTLAAFGATRIVVNRSRFEVDLNRPRARAVYLEPADAWGLRVWSRPPPPDLVERSLEEYDAFYAMIERLLTRRAARTDRFVVLDIHSYNHRRGGPDTPPADPEENPVVNVGTGSLDQRRWGHVVRRFVADLSDQKVAGQPLDVRENVRFRGGFFPEWIDTHCAEAGCCIAVEIKKVFMDEHTGEPDELMLTELCAALSATVPGLVEELRR